MLSGSNIDLVWAVIATNPLVRCLYSRTSGVALSIHFSGGCGNRRDSMRQGEMCQPQNAPHPNNATPRALAVNPSPGLSRSIFILSPAPKSTPQCYVHLITRRKHTSPLSSQSCLFMVMATVWRKVTFHKTSCYDLALPLSLHTQRLA